MGFHNGKETSILRGCSEIESYLASNKHRLNEVNISDADFPDFHCAVALLKRCDIKYEIFSEDPDERMFNF